MKLMMGKGRVKNNKKVDLYPNSNYTTMAKIPHRISELE
jgi:hypothetical protein